jgi:glycerophosphoryl diester phosphodiesterase
VWTVNTEEDMKFCLEHKIDAIITNYPDIALKVREEITGS